MESMLFRYICCSAIAQTSEPGLSWVLPSSRFPLRWRQLLFVFSGESFYHLVSNLMPIQPDCRALSTSGPRPSLLDTASHCRRPT